jgi:hypothetical protein
VEETNLSRSSLYSCVDRRINADAWFRGLSHDAQLIFFRLLSGSHVTPIAGLWPAREEGLAAEFGFTLKQFRELFAELGREPGSNGLPHAVADWKAGVLWLPNSIHQECNQPNNWKSLIGWLKFLEMVPACETRNRALNGFADWIESGDNRKRYGIEKGIPNPELDRLVNCWRNGMRYTPHARDRAESGSEARTNQKQEQVPASPQASPVRKCMTASWKPTDETMASFDVAMIPRESAEELVARARSHYAGNSQDLRTDVDWNQAISKWVFRDWANPSKRPIRPKNESDPMVWDPKKGRLVS